jgi:hypothetical protein
MTYHQYNNILEISYIIIYWIYYNFREFLPAWQNSAAAASAASNTRVANRTIANNAAVARINGVAGKGGGLSNGLGLLLGAHQVVASSAAGAIV